MADADTFVYVERLRRYLQGFDFGRPYWLGRRMRLSKAPPEAEWHFLSGGAGYAVSRAAMEKMLGTPEVWNSTNCNNDEASDTWMMRCLGAVGIWPSDTRDREKRERFHPFDPQTMAGLGYGTVEVQDWYRAYTFGMKLGLAGVSDNTLTYHYLTPQMMQTTASLLASDPESIGIPHVSEERQKQATAEPIQMPPISEAWRPEGTDETWLGPGQDAARAPCCLSGG